MLRDRRRFFFQKARKRSRMPGKPSTSLTLRHAYSSGGVSLIPCTTPWTPDLFEAGTTSGATEENFVWAQRRTGTEVRTSLTFHIVPGTATWEEVEAGALGLALHPYSFRVGHEIWLGERHRQAILTLR